MADWLCHRRTDIETTTGLKETLLHLAMLAEVGVPLLACLFLEITSPVLALMVASFVLHEATALWDVSYAVTAREVTPIEQHVHSFLEMIPLMGGSFVAALHWPEVKALIGVGDRPADWRLARKAEPLPAGYLAAALASFVVLKWLPYLEEMWRDIRTRPGHLMPAPARRAALTAPPGEGFRRPASAPPWSSRPRGGRNGGRRPGPDPAAVRARPGTRAWPCPWRSAGTASCCRP